LRKESQEPIELTTTIDVQSNPNTYAANFKVDSPLAPHEFEFYYRTSAGHRAPHLTLYSLKIGRRGRKHTYSLGFLLKDYPVPKEEKLTLIGKFWFPASK
jgi:hypothetical protein